jgi:hypothetical protein
MHGLGPGNRSNLAEILMFWMSPESRLWGFEGASGKRVSNRGKMFPESEFQQSGQSGPTRQRRLSKSWPNTTDIAMRLIGEPGGESTGNISPMRLLDERRKRLS